MSTGAAATAAVGTDGLSETACTCSAVAVFEVAGGDKSSIEIIPLQFRACHTALPLSPVFTFHMGTEPYTTPYLYITPDCIASLTRTQYAKNNVQDSPRYIDLIRQQLGNPRLNLSCLQFRLRYHGNLQQPAGAIPTPGQQHADNAAAITAFSVANIFSVYLKHDDLSRGKYNIFYSALKPYLDPQQSASAAAPAYTATRYSQGRDAAPGSNESDNDTVAVTTPLGFGWAVDNVGNDDNHVPGYDSHDQVLSLGPQTHCIHESRACSSSREKADSYRRPAKRGRWSPGAAAFAEYEYKSPSPPAHTYYQSSRVDALERRIEIQDARIARVEAENTHLVGQNKVLEARVEKLEAENRHLVQVNKKIGARIEDLDCEVLEIGELEERLDQIQTQQESIDRSIETVEARHIELDESYGWIERQVVNMQRDDHEQLSGDILDMAAEAVETAMEEHLQEYVDTKVCEFEAKLKRKFRDLFSD
jgi:hypothetical protein